MHFSLSRQWKHGAPLTLVPLLSSPHELANDILMALTLFFFFKSLSLFHFFLRQVLTKGLTLAYNSLFPSHCFSRADTPGMCHHIDLLIFLLRTDCLFLFLTAEASAPATSALGVTYLPCTHIKSCLTTTHVRLTGVLCSWIISMPMNGIHRSHNVCLLLTV